MREQFAADQARARRHVRPLGRHARAGRRPHARDARELRWQTDLDLGPILPFDELFAGYDPAAHVIDDFFANKLAFVVLLNFPLTTLERAAARRAAAGPRGSGPRRGSPQRFAKRVPADGGAADLRGVLGRGRQLHRRLQHLDAPPARRAGQAAVSRRAAAAHPLEPARRAQGQYYADRTACRGSG